MVLSSHTLRRNRAVRPLATHFSLTHFGPSLIWTMRQPAPMRGASSWRKIFALIAFRIAVLL